MKSKASDTRYCVKKIIAKFKNQSERTRYIHEVEAVTFLPAHPNVVKYFRAWQENQQFYCQMELCECGSFGGCLERLPPDSLVGGCCAHTLRTLHISWGHDVFFFYRFARRGGF